MNARGLFAIALLLGSAVHAQSVSVERASCLPVEDNGLVKASVTGEAPGQSVRLYFRWKNNGGGDKAFYWVAMEAEPGGRYWATPPKPEKRNTAVEYYGALVDAAGRVVARSATQVTPVTRDCRLQLSPKERGVAENLTIGETSPDQQGREVLAFLCDGVVTRINFAGLRRSDDVCRVCVVAWWKKGALLPAAALSGIIVEEDPEPSPSRP
jgi:hypothetical protein